MISGGVAMSINHGELLDEGLEEVVEVDGRPSAVRRVGGVRIGINEHHGVCPGRHVTMGVIAGARRYVCGGAWAPMT